MDNVSYRPSDFYEDISVGYDPGSSCLETAELLHKTDPQCSIGPGSHEGPLPTFRFAAGLCNTGGVINTPTPFLFFLPACVAGGQPLRQGHQPVQPFTGRSVQELHRLLLRRAATHRQLPFAQDHRQRKLRQGQVGPPHPDRQGGEAGGRGTSREGDGGWF